MCIFFELVVTKLVDKVASVLSTVSLAKVDSGTVTKCNFAGDKGAGASWTDKIMANKADGVGAAAGGEGDGAAEDEWVSTAARSSQIHTLVITST